jgi:hypothetical protein
MADFVDVNLCKYFYTFVADIRVCSRGSFLRRLFSFWSFYFGMTFYSKNGRFARYLVKKQTQELIKDI